MASTSVWEVRLGPVLVDVPRSVGYFGGAALALGLGLVEPPLAVFIAAVPLFKVLTHRALPAPIRFVGEVIEGGAKPVGGDDDPAIQLVDSVKDEEDAREIAAMLERAQRHDREPEQVDGDDVGLVVVQRD
jgi:hypothetical protein